MTPEGGAGFVELQAPYWSSQDTAVFKPKDCGGTWNQSVGSATLALVATAFNT
jgi:hypothetical protein